MGDGGAGGAYMQEPGLGVVRVPILFGNDLLWNDVPFTKGFMKFEYLEL